MNIHNQKKIAILSGIAGAGKTTFTIEYVKTLQANSQNNLLVIESDPDSKLKEKYFKYESRVTLADLIKQDVDLRSCNHISEQPTPNLDFISSGDNELEIINSRFKDNEYFQNNLSLLNKYNYIIFSLPALDSVSNINTSILNFTNIALIPILYTSEMDFLTKLLPKLEKYENLSHCFVIPNKINKQKAIEIVNDFPKTSVLNHFPIYPKNEDSQSNVLIGPIQLHQIIKKIEET